MDHKIWYAAAMWVVICYMIYRQWKHATTARAVFNTAIDIAKDRLINRVDHPELKALCIDRWNNMINRVVTISLMVTSDKGVGQWDQLQIMRLQNHFTDSFYHDCPTTSLNDISDMKYYLREICCWIHKDPMGLDVKYSARGFAELLQKVRIDDAEC